MTSARKLARSQEGRCACTGRRPNSLPPRRMLASTTFQQENEDVITLRQCEQTDCDDGKDSGQTSLDGIFCELNALLRKSDGLLHKYSVEAEGRDAVEADSDDEVTIGESNVSIEPAQRPQPIRH